MLNWHWAGVGELQTRVVGYQVTSDSLRQRFYPSKGQSQEQQEKDRYQCHSWVVQETGFDLMNPPQVAVARVC